MKKRIPSKKSTSRKAAPRSSYHETGILLEDIRHKVELIAEGVDSSNQRIDSLEQKVETKFQDMDRQVKTGFQLLDQKVENVKEVLSTKIDAITTRMDHHEEEIHHLKQAQNLT